MDSGFSIVDLKSQNGTFVNGERIDKADLEYDDVIEIGETVMVILDTDSWNRGEGLTRLRNPVKAQEQIQKINGKAAFAEVFFDEVRVPIENLLGEEGAGWSVAMATAGFERGLMLRSPARFQSTAWRLVESYRAAVERGDPVAPGMRERVARCWMNAEAYALNTYQTVSKLLGGGRIGACSNGNTKKLFTLSHIQREALHQPRM